MGAARGCFVNLTKLRTKFVTKPAYAGMLKRGIGGITNGELVELIELFWTTHSAHQETTALVEQTYCSGV